MSRTTDILAKIDGIWESITEKSQKSKVKSSLTSEIHTNDDQGMKTDSTLMIKIESLSRGNTA